jgi:hypothetical protein
MKSSEVGQERLSDQNSTTYHRYNQSFHSLVSRLLRKNTAEKIDASPAETTFGRN